MNRIALDFDGTIVESKYPHIGGLKLFATDIIRDLYKWNKIIINTCRSGKQKDYAEIFLNKEGIPFDYINENDQSLIDFYKKDTRKISADYYVDDKNFMSIHSLIIVWLYFFFKTLKYRFRRKPTIIAIVGESGTGKTTMADYLEKTYGINQILSYTERPMRKKDESGHVFLTEDQFSQLDTSDLLANTVFGDYRYCALMSDLKDVNTYVIDEKGLGMLERFDRSYYNVYSVRLLRSKQERVKSVGKRRVARDNGAFRIEPTLDNYDFVSRPKSVDEIHAEADIVYERFIM